MLRGQRRPVELVRVVPVALDSAVAVFDREPHRLIGSGRAYPIAWGELRADLGFQLPGAGRLGREVRVGFGPLIDEDGTRTLPVWWEAAEHPELFPTFDGGLELRAAPDGTELRLVGSYRPPLGAWGRFADGLAGHRVVTASLEAFLEATAQRLTAC